MVFVVASDVVGDMLVAVVLVVVVGDVVVGVVVVVVVVDVDVVSVDLVVKRRTSNRGLKLCCAEDQMHAGISVNGAAHLPDLKSERGIFKGFLYLAASKRTQIAPPC